MKGTLHLLYGDEDFLIDARIDELKKKFLPGATSSFGIETIDGRSASVGTVINAAFASPLLGGDKVAIVKDFSGLTSPRKKKGEEEEIEEKEEASGDYGQLIEILKELPANVHLIFAIYGSVDKRRKLFKAIEEAGSVEEFKPFAEWEQEKLLAWIVAQAKSSGVAIASHAARLLMEVSGPSLRALSQEIEKLATYIGDRGTIEEKDVSSIASSGRVSAFALLEALRRRDIKGSLEALSRLLRDKEEPASLLGLIFTQVRMMLQVKSFKEEGLSEYEIAKRLSASPFFVKKSAEGIDNFSVPELRNALELLHSTDMQIKTGSNPQIALEILLVNICQKERSYGTALR